MFNKWKPYPKRKPKETGWYCCSIRYGEDPDEAYVMDLWWDDKKEIWKDNRRINVFEFYDVYGYGDTGTGRPEKIKLWKDHLCIRDDVIAFKKLPKIYK
jgi:hypothetical protein